eukprot:7101021-Pyramimonas_sp.AAC.1
MMRQSFFFCSGHTARSTAVRGSRAAGLATAPGTQPAPGKRVQVSPRLLTAPECSACPCKREWPRRAPAPVA